MVSERSGEIPPLLLFVLTLNENPQSPQEIVVDVFVKASKPPEGVYTAERELVLNKETPNLPKGSWELFSGW